MVNSDPNELDAELEKLLQTDTSKGLTDQEVADRLIQFGKNCMIRLT
jgi:hypothetical protein